MRHDPDGNPKRRAKRGERRCGKCKRYFVTGHSDQHPRGEGYCGRGTETNVFARARCWSQDCANSCKHFVEVTR